MKKITLLLSIIILTISCQRDEVSEENFDENNIANLRSSSSSGLEFFLPCDSTINPLFVNTPFDNTIYPNEFTTQSIEGFFNNTLDCDSPSRECYPSQLKIQLEKEFSRHTNNILCNQKGNQCPTGNATLVESYFDFIEVEPTFNIDLSDDLPGTNSNLLRSEGNLIYQEFMCRLLESDTNASEFIVISDMHWDYLLCCGGAFLVYNIDVYRQ